MNNLPSGAVLARHAAFGDILELTTPAARAIVSLHGAQVMSFTPAGGQDLLWSSSRSRAAEGGAMRGGVPLCGPWFGPHPHAGAGPLHGLMRTTRWTLLGVDTLEGGVLRARFELALPTRPESGWLHHAVARFELTVRAALEMELTVRNLGRTPFMLSGALHTYLRVGDIRRAVVEGLGEREYIDLRDNNAWRRQNAAPLGFTQEEARLYMANAPVRVIDTAMGRTLELSSWGAGATVVWTPWSETGAKLEEIGEDWPQVLCVEAANVPATAVALPPSQSHHLGQRIAVV